MLSIPFVTPALVVPQPEGWHLTLGLGDLVSIAGTLVGIVGLYLAYDQSRKVDSAKKAVKDYRSQLYQQRASQRFSDAAPKAVALVAQIRAKDWPSCSALATELGAGLANAQGFCGPLINEEEQKTLKLAAEAVKYILEHLPTADSDVPDANQIKEMSRQCFLTLYAVYQVSGRLKSIDEVEGSNG